MSHHESVQPDYGTGQKKLSIYVAGVAGCIILTLVAFWAVMSGHFSKAQTFLVIFSAAIVQFFVQVVCFLRLNARSEQGRFNVMVLLFTAVILMAVIAGTLWIMWNMNYNMM